MPPRARRNLRRRNLRARSRSQRPTLATPAESPRPCHPTGRQSRSAPSHGERTGRTCSTGRRGNREDVPATHDPTRHPAVSSRISTFTGPSPPTSTPTPSAWAQARARHRQGHGGKATPSTTPRTPPSPPTRPPPTQPANHSRLPLPSVSTPAWRQVPGAFQPGDLVAGAPPRPRRLRHRRHIRPVRCVHLPVAGSGHGDGEPLAAQVPDESFPVRPASRHPPPFRRLRSSRWTCTVRPSTTTT